MTPAASAFYLDWTFWAFVSSAVAIFLSQLPPLSALFFPGVLVMEVSDFLNLTHAIGHANANMMLSLHNVGGRLVRVKKIELVFRRDGKELIVIPVRRYFLHPESASPVVFFPFNLGPKYEWVHGVNAHGYLSREEDREFRQLLASVRRDVREKLIARRKQAPSSQALVEVNPKLVTEGNQLRERNFLWTPGDYDMEVRVTTASGMAPEPQKFRFTLFESDSADLIRATDEYKYGHGIGFDHRPLIEGISVPLRPGT